MSQVPVQHGMTGDTGGLAALFVRRPVLAIVVSMLIVVAGLAALFAIEIRELPEVDSPVVTVVTTYSGAAPETIDREITARIEGGRANAGAARSRPPPPSDGPRYRESQSTDIDVAANDLKDAISRISRDLRG